jgi:hypothetical protein
MLYEELPNTQPSNEGRSFEISISTPFVHHLLSNYRWGKLHDPGSVFLRIHVTDNNSMAHGQGSMSNNLLVIMGVWVRILV